MILWYASRLLPLSIMLAVSCFQSCGKVAAQQCVIAPMLPCQGCSPGWTFNYIYQAWHCCECSSGTYKNYCDGGSQQSCSPCQAGTYNPSTGSTDSSACTPCQPGTYSPSPGSSACDICQAGTYNPSYGRSACDICQAGTYNPSNGSTDSSACTPCQPGTYNPSPGSSACTPCKPGTFNPSPGSSVVCSPCLEGTYSPSDGSSACTPCPEGTYNSLTGSKFLSACIPCQPGTYNPLTGSSVVCTLCKEGTYNPSYRSSACTPCPKGTYNSLTGSSSLSACLPCEAGTYNPSYGRSACDICQAGTYNPSNGSTDSSACILCQAGTYNPSTGSSVVCSPCSAGQHSPSLGSSFCQSCDPGSYSASGQASCSDCPAGSYCTDPAQKPVECSVGSYCPVKSSAPYICQPGYLCESRGLAQEAPCPPGYYCPSSVKSIPCPAGSFSSSPGARQNFLFHAAKPAFDYTFSGQSSDSSCRPCSSSQICPEGTSNPTAAQTTTTWQIVAYVFSGFGSFIGIFLSVFKVYPAIKDRISKLRTAGIKPTIMRVIFLDKALAKYRPLLSLGERAGSSQAVDPENKVAVGARMQVTGLASRPDLNGSTVTVCGNADAATGRWTVRSDLDSSLVQLLPQNMKAVSIAPVVAAPIVADTVTSVYSPPQALLRLTAKQIGDTVNLDSPAFQFTQFRAHLMLVQVAAIGPAYVDCGRLITENNLTGKYIAGEAHSVLVTTLADIGISKKLHVSSIMEVLMLLKSGDEAALDAACSRPSS